MAAYTLLNAATAVGAGPRVTMEATPLRSSTGKTVVQASVLGGTGATQVILEGQLADVGWVPLVTFDLTAAGATPVTDGEYIESLWLFLRARTTTVPSGGAVTVIIYREGQ